VISGVAEQAADRIAHLVYLDAYVLDDGQSMADQVGPEIMSQLLEVARMFGDGWRLPHDPPDADRRTDQSLMPVLTPLALQSTVAADLPRMFILCTEGSQDIGPLHVPIEQAAERAKSDARWQYRELQTGHMPMWTAPEELTALLLEIA
jgi:pimeloyl-ACP methyl ester carboxylesterase